MERQNGIIYSCDWKKLSHPIVIGPQKVVTNCYCTLSINPYSDMCRVHVRNTASTLKFDLSDLKIPELWNKKLIQLLSDLPEVFSTDDMYVGCAKSAQHTFRLTDATPFRERPQRIAPKDVNELRQTLH